MVKPFLRAGQKIVVPYGYPIVDTTIKYTYETMEMDIRDLKARYPFLETGVAGKSVLGRDLHYIRLGSGPNQVFYNGAHHALEWITTPLLMKFAEEFLKAYTEGKNLSHGYDPRDIWSKSSIYLIPMVNPDGVDLVLNGLHPDNPYYQDLLRWNKGSTDFSKTWQANVRGVDLNHNYNAAWQQSKNAEAAYGIKGPGPTRYGGTAPESEPEAKAAADFTRSHDFRLVIAYHSQGQVIFYDFMGMAPPEGKTIAEQFAKVSGYSLGRSTGIASYGGYKDWFIQDYRRPGYTIEVGRGKNPLPVSQFQQIYNSNLEIMLLASII
ncbi:M14 family metallocarboxypeptidase [Clostridiales bacterium BAD-6]|jgi:g-D-glutamyl-meso-diaminopimelate peptidase|uniref:M14 family metallocarboxypeptidase n=1 Tax=Sinanaerobacter chloroacetimidivorans TaxID=2818044 RepID=A0A8J7W3Z1_9FIRM|nr:M14 family metallocarboxypeptidase [Sinanaerobacter chloroacetimidivorans]